MSGGPAKEMIRAVLKGLQLGDLTVEQSVKQLRQMGLHDAHIAVLIGLNAPDKPMREDFKQDAR